VEDQIELLQGDAGRVASNDDPRGVHEDVDPPAPTPGPLHRGLPSFWVAHVCRDGEEPTTERSDLAPELAQRRLGAGDAGDVGADGGQPERDRPADAPTGS